MPKEILKTKKERLAYIEECVKRGNERRAKLEKDNEEVAKLTEADDSGY